MATDHRGNELHAGKRTSDQIRTRVNPMNFIIQEVYGEDEDGNTLRPTRRRHNEMFTAPKDITYDTYEVEGPNGKMYTIEDETKPIKFKPVYEYPYPPKYRVKPTKAINPPPKRRNSVPKVKEAPTEEQKANRDLFW